MGRGLCSRYLLGCDVQCVVGIKVSVYLGEFEWCAERNVGDVGVQCTPRSRSYFASVGDLWGGLCAMVAMTV